MPNWIVYGIIASVFFALNTILYKVAAQKGNFSPYYGSFMFGLGVVLIFGLFLLFKPSFEFELKSSSLALIAGMIWGLGFLAIAVAIAQKADIARLAPIYNTNTILAVLMAIIFLKEIPDVSQVYRIIAGAVLIVIGAILVSV
ncbi:EamA family transporter [Candidatus Woesearchaeota archaeon]|nr:EamA family transporter [Candidatus Woesearchaeota archaeon]